MKSIRHKNTIITKLPNGKYTWSDSGEKSLKECKAEIDNEGGAPWRDIFKYDHER